MGINGLNDFLKKQKVKCFKEGQVSSLMGKKIAIDGGKILAEAAARNYKVLILELDDPTADINEVKFSKNFISDILSTLFYFISNDIIPLLIFDGARHPEKEKTLTTRKSNKEARNEKISTAITEYNLSIENPMEIGFNSLSKDELKQLRKNNFTFDYNIIILLKDILTNLGIFHQTAEYEAESLCCSLVYEEKAYAVYSSDSDCYTFRIDYVITKINMRRDTYEYVSVKRIIKWIENKFFICEETDEETKKEAENVFLDFCIMCGCDFNTRIPQIGPKRAFDLLFDCDRLKNLKHENKKMLKRKVCEVLLSPFDTNIESEELIFNSDLFLENIDDIYRNHCNREIEREIRRLKRIIRNK